MLLQIDQRGSLNLPTKIRQMLGLKKGSNLELEVLEGGNILLHPVEIHRTVRLSNEGLDKLNAARASAIAPLPKWLSDELSDEMQT